MHSTFQFIPDVFSGIEFIGFNAGNLSSYTTTSANYTMGHYHACWNRLGLGALIIVRGHFTAKGHWGKKIIFPDVYVHYVCIYNLTNNRAWITSQPLR